MKYIFSLALSLISLINIYAQNKITKHLEFGKYHIGYKVIHIYDHSRSYFSKYDYYGNRTEYPIGRPIQISIWYPSQKSKKSYSVLYQDYLGHTSSEIDFEKNTEKDRKTTIDTFINSIDGKSKQEQLKELLSSKTHAHFNGQELNIEFPIILYAPPMNTSAIDNSIICEFLASKGYVVLSTMSKGEYTQLHQRTIRSVNVQAEDLGFLLDYAQNNYATDKVGVFGFSLGGLANIIFASKNKSVDATVSLDGSIMSKGWLNDFKNSELYAPKAFTSNLLFIGKNLKAPNQNPSTFLDSVKYADKALIRYDIEEHSYFSGLYLLYGMINNTKLANTEKEMNYRFYAEMTEYIGYFFDEYLKGIENFKEYEHKSYDFSFSFEKGNRVPLNPNTVGQLIVDKGFSYVNTIIDSTLIYEKDYLSSFDWRSLVQTAKNLKSSYRIDESIQTLLLADKVFPSWYVIHNHLGKLYLEKKDIALAENHFRIALEDNPKDVKSLEALKQLKKSTPDYHVSKIEDIKPYLGKYIVDEERYREIYLKNGNVYLKSNYWDEPLVLWPYRTDLFLVESDNPGSNMQVLFQFNEKGAVVSMSIRGLNSGRINVPDQKEKP
ncbi:dienelactone hydrolase family protein [Winogradskyella sp.]|uniref:dienelactone hydrolase family protein n=1 Tax=Winogradskyella sp. TaxID=1883156 RepID=UPI00262682F0|nr:dienelactone hydrolase family protein [Winogradskyella sp.]